MSRPTLSCLHSALLSAEDYTGRALVARLPPFFGRLRSGGSEPTQQGTRNEGFWTSGQLAHALLAARARGRRPGLCALHAGCDGVVEASGGGCERWRRAFVPLCRDARGAQVAVAPRAAGEGQPARRRARGACRRAAAAGVASSVEWQCCSPYPAHRRAAASPAATGAGPGERAPVARHQSPAARPLGRRPALRRHAAAAPAVATSSAAAATTAAAASAGACRAAAPFGLTCLPRRRRARRGAALGARLAARRVRRAASGAVRRRLRSRAVLRRGVRRSRGRSRRGAARGRGCGGGRGCGR